LPISLITHQSLLAALPTRKRKKSLHPPPALITQTTTPITRRVAYRFIAPTHQKPQPLTQARQSCVRLQCTVVTWFGVEGTKRATTTFSHATANDAEQTPQAGYFRGPFSESGGIGNPPNMRHTMTDFGNMTTQTVTKITAKYVLNVWCSTYHASTVPLYGAIT
jgi:hypothetical protein